MAVTALRLRRPGKERLLVVGKFASEKILSVCVAAYNVQETLREALDPFTKSDVLDLLDIMIINDGSTDQTAQIAQEYVEAFPNSFRLINKENGGWGSTLNTGIQAAVGKYFKNLDGDDYFSIENVTPFVEFLKTATADAVHAPFYAFEHGTGRIIGERANYTRFPFQVNLELAELEDFSPLMHAWTVRTQVLQQNPITITEHCFYTDVEYVLKTSNFCETVAFFPLPIYCYRLSRSGQSMSLEGVRKHYLEHLTMVTTMLRYEKEHLRDPRKHSLFSIRLLGVCNTQYLFFFALACNRTQKQQLIAYDTLLKNEYPQYYKKLTGRQIRLLRATHFTGYWLIGHMKTAKDKRLKQNVFDGT